MAEQSSGGRFESRLQFPQGSAVDPAPRGGEGRSDAPRGEGRGEGGGGYRGGSDRGEGRGEGGGGYRGGDRDRGDRGDSRGEGGFRGRPRRFHRGKVCAFCIQKSNYVDYKDLEVIRRFLTDRGKILPRRITGNCAKHQRMLTHTVKRARNVALLPYKAQ